MRISTSGPALSIAVPKGRLLEPLLEFMTSRGVGVSFAARELVATSADGNMRFLQVKNADLPTYVGHGIAGLGICGTDKLAESDQRLFRLGELPFGRAKVCLIGRRGASVDSLRGDPVRVATKYPTIARDYFHERGIPVEIIKLSGSVELAPVLGLAPLIVDVVETGRTLASHDLSVVEEITTTTAQLVANPAFYKVQYRAVGDLLDRLQLQPAMNTRGTAAAAPVEG